MNLVTIAMQPGPSTDPTAGRLAGGYAVFAGAPSDSRRCVVADSRLSIDGHFKRDGC